MKKCHVILYEIQNFWVGKPAAFESVIYKTLFTIFISNPLNIFGWVVDTDARSPAVSGCKYSNVVWQTAILDYR